LKREDLRNIAIVAHVDHGKTTLVEKILKQCNALGRTTSDSGQIMDSNDQERERGITIFSKNASAYYGDVKINIIDTPGHADFGGEVERVLKMADGALLLVDAAEGPMPQTRSVLSKVIEMGQRVVVVINKIDRPDARAFEVLDEVLDLLIALDANDDQLDSPVVFCSSKNGTASMNPDGPFESLDPLLECIVNWITPPEVDGEGELQMLVSAIDYNDYVGRIGIGKVERGTVSKNSEVAITNYNSNSETYFGKIANLYVIEGIERKTADEVSAGDIVCISGIENINIGDTVCSPDDISPLAFYNISEPTVEMTFSVNNGPFAGRDGKYLTSRHLGERLKRELQKDVSLKVTGTDTTESFRVAGRGEMHLSVLIEKMRREGYEFLVGAPRVLIKEVDGEKFEPVEFVSINVPPEYAGAVIEKLGSRKGEMTGMEPAGDRMKIEFLVASRGLFGYRGEFLSDTRGEGTMSTVFHSYRPFMGDIMRRSNGALVAFETGEAVTYGLHAAQQRGTLFISPGTPVYEGMVVGEASRPGDINVNVCKKKHVTNMRASGSDDALRLVPPKAMSLEECIEFISEDEMIEITPESLRIRKTILDNNMRAKAKK